MRKNKKLNNFIENSLACHTNKNFLEELKTEISCGKAIDSLKRSNIKFSITIFGGLAATLACVIVSVLLLFEFGIINIGLKGKTDFPPAQNKFYSAENLSVKEASLEEFTTEHTEILLREEGLVRIDKAVDIYYNETLYYVAKYDDPERYDLLNVIIVVNPEYQYNSGHTNYTNECKIGDYSVRYLETISEEEGLFSNNTIGKMYIGTNALYLEYESISLTEKSNFLSMLKRTLTL